MTIDEAIEHAEERVRGNDRCAKDYAQLADWLCELRRARMEIDLLKTLRDGFKADAQKYKTENAKLRELVRDYERCSVHTDCANCKHDGKLSEHCPYSPCFPDADELCQLGIEVEDE